MSEAGGDGTALTVTLIRCSTLLLACGGARLLTDPWFGMTMRGLPVFRRPGISPRALPPVDAVLVSHLHPDHFDPRGLARLVPPPGAVLLPPGGLDKLGSTAHGHWRELAPWDSTAVGDVEVVSVPAIHTGPGPDEVNFVVRFPRFGAVYFGGDARLDRPLFEAIERRLGPVRVALLPVGGTHILGKRTVMNPTDALAAADILGARNIVPIHEGGIWLSVPPLSRHPGRARHLARLAAERGQAGRVTVLAEGESARFT